MSEQLWDTIVVGAGIAGIAAAIRLASAGQRTLLLESRKKLGGRATTHTDQSTGEAIDNCQHIAMGCCTNYLDLLDRLGVAADLDWHRTVTWLTEGLPPSTMRDAPLPVPGQYGLWLARANFLSLTERARLALAMLAALRADRDKHRDHTFAQWLDAHKQSVRAVERFWTPVMVSAANVTPDRLCAAVGLHVLQEGFLAARRSAHIGVPRVPLEQLYRTAPSILEAKGSAVRTGASVTRIDERSATLATGEVIHAQRIICALPAERAIKAIDPTITASDDRFRWIERVEHSPIVGVHLRFDRPVLTTANAVLVGRETHWLFNKGHNGAHIHAVKSGAVEWLPLTEPQIIEKVLADIHACIPESHGAELLWSRAIKEKRATFVPSIDAERDRPASLSPNHQGIILAGDYTDTGWPSTMEGATRSGYTAAAIAMGLNPSALITSSLPPAPLVRSLGGTSLRRQGHTDSTHRETHP